MERKKVEIRAQTMMTALGEVGASVQGRGMGDASRSDKGEVAKAGKHLVVAWDGGRSEVERRGAGQGHEALEKPS